MKRGRPGVKTPEAVRWRILELYQSGLSGNKIAARLDIPRGTVYRLIQEARTEPLVFV